MITGDLKTQSEVREVAERVQSYAIAVIREIKLRWPTKTAQWATDDQLGRVWTRAILENIKYCDEFTLKRALTKFSGTYPADVYDLINIVKNPLSSNDVELSLTNLRRCMSSVPVPDYSLLNQHELWCSQQLSQNHGGYYELNILPKQKQIELWSQLISKSLNIPNENLPNLIKKPVAVLPKTEQQKEMECIKKKMNHQNFSAFTKSLWPTR